MCDAGFRWEVGLFVSSHLTPQPLNLPIQLSLTRCRGMQTTCYVKMAAGVTVDQLRDLLVKTYANEPFVKVRMRLQPHTPFMCVLF